jgi:hypothetical protein
MYKYWIFVCFSEIPSSFEYKPHSCISRIPPKPDGTDENGFTQCISSQTYVLTSPLTVYRRIPCGLYSNNDGTDFISFYVFVSLSSIDTPLLRGQTV